MHASQHGILGNDWCVTALTCQIPLHDINMQPAKETRLKMLTDQSTKKKKYVRYFLQRGEFSSTSMAGKKKTGNQTLNVEMLVTAWSEQKNIYIYITYGELSLRPLPGLSAPSFRLPHYFGTGLNQGGSTFIRSNLGICCKSVHCSMVGFGVS